MKKPTTTMVKFTLLTLFTIFIIIQAVPYGRNHNNPPIIREPKWESPNTRSIAKRACFDCHSNETIWPWYTWVAPFSWLVSRDVEEGRNELNFSEWQNGRRKGEKPSEIREQITEGGMPPIEYGLVHPDARLTGDEERQLVEGLTATIMQSSL